MHFPPVITTVTTVFRSDYWGCGVSFPFFTGATDCNVIKEQSRGEDLWYENETKANESGKTPKRREIVFTFIDSGGSIDVALV